MGKSEFVSLLFVIVFFSNLFRVNNKLDELYQLA